MGVSKIGKEKTSSKYPTIAEQLVLNHWGGLFRSTYMYTISWNKHITQCPKFAHMIAVPKKRFVLFSHVLCVKLCWTV